MLIICAKYLVNRMNSVKSRGGEVRLTPPPLMPSCDFFYLMPFRVNNIRGNRLMFNNVEINKSLEKYHCSINPCTKGES